MQVADALLVRPQVCNPQQTTAKKNPAPTTKNIWSYAKYGCNPPIAVAPSERAKFTTPM